LITWPQAVAKAADLGGDCCSELEDRVAEPCDDHVESNTYSVDNNYSSLR
jgi:hypothetical protein